ncbi:MAG TPA: alpha/beta hydrolase [Bacteroidetes bacterium]|nr:alpha/beta hydrolase [Bacteroidota bacterium]
MTESGPGSLRKRLLLIALVILLAMGIPLWMVLSPAWQDPVKFFENRRSQSFQYRLHSSWNENGLVIQSLRISGMRQSFGGEYNVEFDAYCCAPEHSERLLPGFVLLGGVHTGREAVQVITSRPDIARLGMFVTLDYPYSGPLYFEGLEILPHLSEIRRSLFDGVEAIRLAIDYLEDQKGVDASRIVLVGVSLGAFFTVDAGAVDARPAAVMSFMGGGDIKSILELNLRRGELVPYSFLIKPISSLAALLIRPLETTRLVGEISPRPYIQISARDDTFIPEENALALYRTAGEPRRLIWISTPHLMPGMEEIMEQMIAIAGEELIQWGIFQETDFPNPKMIEGELPSP